jgi:hypothetical protein
VCSAARCARRRRDTLQHATALTAVTQLAPRPRRCIANSAGSTTAGRAGAGNCDCRFCERDISGGGRAHRRRYTGTGGVYSELKRSGFPGGSRVLCFNCNLAGGAYAIVHITANWLMVVRPQSSSSADQRSERARLQGTIAAGGVLRRQGHPRRAAIALPSMHARCCAQAAPSRTQRGVDLLQRRKCGLAAAARTRSGSSRSITSTARGLADRGRTVAAIVSVPG